MKEIIIAIDGYSSCGKSTLAKMLSKEINYAYIDTGAMYRAVTLYFISQQVNIQNDKAVAEALKHIKIHFEKKKNERRTFLNDVDVEEAIRTMMVAKKVSEVAAVSAVRRKMVEQQQEMGSSKSVILDGRDIGTVVFPTAEVKIFLTAKLEERARRRHIEVKSKGKNISYEEVLENLRHRDHIDTSRADSPLKQAADAIVVDNTNLTQAEQMAMVLTLVNLRRKDQEIVGN
ncbi:MAG: (d)CMP kinase [Bacteroidota bacterium]